MEWHCCQLRYVTVIFISMPVADICKHTLKVNISPTQVLAIQVLAIARTFMRAVEMFSINAVPTSHPVYKALKNTLLDLAPVDVDLDVLGIIIAAAEPQ